ncbi:MAG: outer membrane beta-barrel protein [Prevotella sp.]|nr:outer membrane beta-barrel protein [Prevotella sp.]
MNQEKWIEQLRDKLADHKVAPPEGMWDEIEAALPELMQNQQPKKARFVPLRRWLVAAGLVALLATGGYWWWSQETPRQEVMADASEKATIITEGTRGQHQNDNPKQEEPQAFPVGKPSTSPKRKSFDKLVTLTQSESTQSESASLSETCKDDSSVSDGTKESPRDNLFVSQEKELEVIKELEKEIFELSKQQKRSVSVGLYAMNGFGDQTGRNGVFMSNEMLQKYNIVNSNSTRTRTPVYLAGYEERQKHNQPLSFGLSASYPLTERLSLTSGIVFTRLHADFQYIMPTHQIKKEQTLCYLGIPLLVNYRLWQYHGLKVYFNVGGQVDWNISISLKSNGVAQEMNKDRMQWSVNGALGVEYDIIPQLGLYAEPGIKYYFDNGSRVQTFFKEKPTSFNLQLGLRWNITR